MEPPQKYLLFNIFGFLSPEVAGPSVRVSAEYVGSIRRGFSQRQPLFRELVTGERRRRVGETYAAAAQGHT